MAIAQIFDNAYKFIFSNKRIFLQLIKSFVTEEFVKDITLDDIEFVSKSFVTEEFLARESDLIYKIRLKNTEVYIYILLEFQSTVDKSIPVRMLLYIIQFYDLLLRNSQKGLLPAIFPILLYNGQDNWIAILNLFRLSYKKNNAGEKTALTIEQIENCHCNECKKRQFSI